MKDNFGESAEYTDDLDFVPSGQMGEVTAEERQIAFMVRSRKIAKQLTKRPAPDPVSTFLVNTEKRMLCPADEIFGLKSPIRLMGQAIASEVKRISAHKQNLMNAVTKLLKEPQGTTRVYLGVEWSWEDVRTDAQLLVSLYRDMTPEEHNMHFKEAPGSAYLYPEKIGQDPITQLAPFVAQETQGKPEWVDMDEVDEISSAEDSPSPIKSPAEDLSELYDELFADDFVEAKLSPGEDLPSSTKSANRPGKSGKSGNTGKISTAKSEKKLAKEPLALPKPVNLPGLVLPVPTRPQKPTAVPVVDLTQEPEPSVPVAAPVDDITDSSLSPVEDVSEATSKPSSQVKGSEPRQDNRFACPGCPRTFVRRGWLRSHLLRCKHDTSTLCLECLQSFGSIYELLNHGETHFQKTPYGCWHCARRFESKEHRDVHVLSHGKRSWACSECNKGFHSRKDLKEHLKVHRGENPFYCKECLTVFPTKEKAALHGQTDAQAQRMRHKCSVACKRHIFLTQRLGNHLPSQSSLLTPKDSPELGSPGPILFPGPSPVPALLGDIPPAAELPPTPSTGTVTCDEMMLDDL